MLKLINKAEPNATKAMSDMEPLEVATIASGQHSGEIVMRLQDEVMSISDPGEDGFWSHPLPKTPVNPLAKGTKITIELFND